MITRDLSTIPTKELRARAVGMAVELLSRGVTVEEMCHRIGMSEDEFWSLLKGQVARLPDDDLDSIPTIALVNESIRRGHGDSLMRAMGVDSLDALRRLAIAQDGEPADGFRRPNEYRPATPGGGPISLQSEANCRAGQFAGLS